MTSSGQHVMFALGNLMTESRDLLLAEGERGLRPSHHRVIGHVPAEGITVTDLAQRVGMTKQGTGQFVTQLAEAGYLSTSVDPQDRRVRVVRRTAQGDQAALALSALLDDLEDTWAKRVGRTRYREFRTVLDQIAGLG